MTDDLRLSRVRVVPMGGVGDSKRLLEGLRAAAGFIRRARKEGPHEICSKAGVSY